MIKFVPIGSKNEKGKALERVFGAVLTNLGYIDLRYDPQRIGEEIDIKGKHKVTARSIKCQCKAHAAEIPTPPLRTFLGDVVSERGRNSNTDGIFISSSGFNSTALEWYDDLSDGEKDYFKLVDANKLFDFLKASNMVCSEEELKLSVLKKTKIPYKDSSLIMSERGVFWEVQLEDEHSGEIYNMMLDSYGEQVKIVDMDYLLSKSELSNKTYIMLEIKENILLKLLTTDNININELISVMDDPEIEIKATVANLLAERLIVQILGDIHLRREIDSFLGLTRYFDDSDNIIQFMSSNYFSNMINTHIIPFIEGKFRLSFDEMEAKVVRRMVKLSPKALKFCLFGDSEHYVNNAEHLEELSLESSKLREQQAKTRSHFIEKLSRDLMIDYELHVNSKLIDDKEIVLVVTQTKIAFAEEFEIYLKVEGSKNFTTRVELAGPVRNGQLVSANGPGVTLKSANAASALGEFEYAMEQYDFTIENWPLDKNAVVEAINNKGLIYLAQKDYNNAENQFNKVRFEELARPQVLNNLCWCYANLGRRKALENTLIVISKKWPEEAVKLKKELGWDV